MINSRESSPDQKQEVLKILREDFCGIFDSARKAEAALLFDEIAEAYEVEGRIYHNLVHIKNLLAFLKKHDWRIKDLQGVKLAAWLHDIVYNTRATDNEEQSAQYAQRSLGQLGIPEQVIAHVAALIRATATHEAIKGDSDSEIFLDGDLVILGSNEKDYDNYASKIREEYAWVPEQQYREGRIKVLEAFLKRPKIYFTEEISEELKQQARKNIGRELTALSQPH